MSITISVPGKSFLAGEYLALNGGPAILLTTAPKFELRVRKGSGWSPGIDQDSPAGKLIRKHASYFNQFDLEFIDPHMGRGGWGASTAQFLSVYSLLQWQSSALVEAERYFDTHKMLHTYRDLAWDGRGLPPSGADLVGQLKGGIAYFDKQSGQLANLKWNFSDLEFFLVPTGQKVATHEHLASLGPISTENLEMNLRLVHEGFQTSSKVTFIAGLNAYADELRRRKWVHPKTLEMIEKFRSIPGVLAAKGCGALGADVVLIIVEKDKSVLFEALLKDESRQYFTRDHLSTGLSLVVNGEMQIENSALDVGL